MMQSEEISSQAEPISSRWKYMDLLELLRITVAENPYQTKHGSIRESWADIGVHVSNQTYRTRDGSSYGVKRNGPACKTKIDWLVATPFNVVTDSYLSGCSNAEIGDFLNLCTELAAMKAAAETNKAAEASSKEESDKSKQVAEAYRETAMKTWKESRDDIQAAVINVFVNRSWSQVYV